MTCNFRPIDPDTGKGVEGGLNITTRTVADSDLGLVAVIYSQEDPRINCSFALSPEVTDSSVVVRTANNCTPFVEGLDAGLGDFDTQIKKSRKARESRVCELRNLMSKSARIPDGLLYRGNN